MCAGISMWIFWSAAMLWQAACRPATMGWSPLRSTSLAVSAQVPITASAGSCSIQRKNLFKLLLQLQCLSQCSLVCNERSCIAG